MKTRPKKLVILAVFLLALACSFPMQVMALYGHTPLELSAILGKLAPLNLAIMLVAPLTAWMAFNASPWLLGALPALTALVFYNNWLVGNVATDYSWSATTLGSLAFVAGVAFLMNRDALEALLNPATRWWMTPMRKQISMPVRFKLLSRRRTPRKSEDAFDEFQVRTFDLSEGGAFIPADQSTVIEVGADSRELKIFGTILRNLATGTQCYVSLPLGGVSHLQCRAEVVRNSPGRGEYPAGVGLRFLGLTRAERQMLHRYLEAAPMPEAVRRKPGAGPSDKGIGGAGGEKLAA